MDQVVASGLAASPILESAALLVAGVDPEQPARARALGRAIGQLDQTLRSTRGRWAIRRLTAAGDERQAPTRVGIKQALEAIARQTADVAVVAITGTVTSAAGEPALVTGATYRAYHEDATLPLGWIGQRLAALGGRPLVALVSARADGEAPPVEAWLAALAAPGTGHAVFVEAVETAEAAEAEEAPAGIAALCEGFRGGAVDPETGTVTLRSIAEWLACRAPAARTHVDRQPQTIVRPASLDDLRALGWSRPAAEPAAGAAADLSCAVLRGEIRVDELLAQGSFGVVYRARQLWMGRDVALKVLPPGVDARSEDGQLFLDEIRAVARIDHPNVVRVFQADETYDGRLFFAMELLAGEDLDRLADRGPVSQPRAIALARALLEGLAAAHEAGLIHADVKPGNVFLASGAAGERVVLLDFGLARLARRGAGAESAGGTPQYMAPEQLTHGRVDERSDVFSAGLVLVTLLTGWRRRRAADLVPPLELIADAALRAVLARALAIDPAARLPSAADFAAALGALAAARGGGGAAPDEGPAAPRRATTIAGSEPELAQPPPFRRLRPFSERDRDRFFGRDREVTHLLDHVLELSAVIYTAPSGVGKTSLLGAGLLPRLEALGGRGIYVACHAGGSDPGAAILAALGGGASLAEAWAAGPPAQAGRRVLVIDQIEAVLGSDEVAAGEVLMALLGGARAGDERDQSVVISVREDFLGRLVDRLGPYASGVAILRLPPLTPDGARAALARPLAARRLAIEDDLLAHLISDLTAAAASLGAEMGWGATPAVYPPHLQLAGARLYESLPDAAAALTLRQYQHLGGIDEIVRSHLAHVLESELARAQVPIARELFKHLITPAQTRAAPTEAELFAALAPTAGGAATGAVLEALRHHGLVVRLARGHRAARWELIHDSLIPRIQAWMDEHDLERRRALELLRHHARQSRPQAPSLLSARELRALRAVPEAIEIVDREWRDREALAAGEAERPWTPARLVARSRAVHRGRRLIAAGVSAAVVAVLSTLGAGWWQSRQAQQLQAAQIAANLGRFELELAPFDWDAARLARSDVPIAALPGLRWELHEADLADLDAPGAALRFDVTLESSVTSADGLTRIDAIEAPGRPGVLLIYGRGRAGADCPASIIPIRTLPGYAQRAARPRLRVAIPTCDASAAGTIALPGGRFWFGGPGTPPSEEEPTKERPRAERVLLESISIDRTEVTNAAFEIFTTMSALTEILPLSYPNSHALNCAGQPEYPAGGATWQEARAYCRYLGKDLPTSQEWQRALRGNEILTDGTPNPALDRNLPWGDPRPGDLANIQDVGKAGPCELAKRKAAEEAGKPGEKSRPAPVGAFPEDRSPDGVLDLAGNMSEWTRSLPIDGDREMRIVRGGNWFDTKREQLIDFMAIENPRPRKTSSYAIGFRCVTSPGSDRGSVRAPRRGA